MRRWLLLLLFPQILFAQGVRFDAYNMTSANNVPFGAQAPIFTLPNSTVTVCAYPDDGGQPCGNVIPIYSDPGLTQTADNPITADVHGRFGFWLAPGTYTYSVMTQDGRFAGTFIFTLGGTSGGGSGCVGSSFSPDGQLCYTLGTGFGSSPNITVVSPTNTQTASAATQGLVVNNVTNGLGTDHVNLQLNSAVDPSSNYSYFSPHLWKMQCANSGTSQLGCSLNLFDDDSDVASSANGGLLPIWIKMLATQPGDHPSYTPILIDSDVSDSVVTTAGLEGIQFNGPTDTFNDSHFDHVTGLTINLKAATEFSSYEHGIHITTPPGVTPPSAFCDFWAGDTNSNVREKIGCGASHISTFVGPVILPLYTPASSSAACTAGQIADDSSYHYVCTATNTWKRVALSSF